jgi:hypothetical protein
MPKQEANDITFTKALEEVEINLLHDCNLKVII